VPPCGRGEKADAAVLNIAEATRAGSNPAARTSHHDNPDHLHHPVEATSVTTPSAPIAFLHTSPVHVATFDRLLDSALPDRPRVHLVDESLLADARRHGLDEALSRRLDARLDQLASGSPAVIVCTCSTIGPLAESAAHRCPVIRVDRPMAEAAIAIASRAAGTVGVAAALESTIAPTLDLLADVATHRATPLLTGRVEAIPCFDAWPAFEHGDMDAYGQAIAGAIRPVADRCAVIVLAQASMAVAQPFLRDVTVPILDSPALLVEAVASRLLDR
jgi:hypothetical protein